MNTLQRYVWNILLAVDDLCSAVFFGDPYETISSRLGKASFGRYGKWAQILTHPIYLFVNLSAFIFFNQAHHCEKSILNNAGSRAVDGTEKCTKCDNCKTY